jgi:hypothetical protein
MSAKGMPSRCDQRHPPQDFPGITPLVALIAIAFDQAPGFIKMQCRDGHAAAGGKLADGKFFMHLFRGDH